MTQNPRFREPTGYTAQEPLHSSAGYQLWHATRNHDGVPVVLKLPTDRSDLQHDRMRFEFSLLQRCANAGIPSVAKPIDLVEDDSGPVLVLEDLGKHSIVGARLNIQQVMQVGAKLADTLSGLHRIHVIHTQVTPEHVIFDFKTGDVYLVDLSQAVQVPRQRPYIEAVDCAAATVYTPPEQTGWIQQCVDLRSDLYGLGVTLFELLTLTPPIMARTTEPLSIIHAILTQTPKDVRILAPDVPRHLAELVAKLLAKNPADRYQSAAGVGYDLRCMVAQQEDITLLERDRAEWFDLPTGMFGRQAETVVLQEVVARCVRDGSREFLLVTGPAGVGKTTLLEELRRVCNQHERVLFGSAKADPLAERPFAALSLALEGIVRSVLSLHPLTTKECRDHISATIQDAFGDLTELFPSLRPLLPSEGPEPQLPPDASETRLVYSVGHLLHAISMIGPVVILLDDAQWLDTASIRLLNQVIASVPEATRLLFVAAHRSGEAEAPTTLRFETDAVRETCIEIGPLSLADVVAFVRAALHWDVSPYPDEASIREVARMLYNKTGGVPLDLCEMLIALADAGVVRFEPELRRWTCDENELSLMPVSTRVGETLLPRLPELPRKTRELLRIASVIGGTVPFALLARIIKCDVNDAISRAWPAVSLGVACTAPGGHRDAPALRFAHDQLHSAIYAELGDDERTAIHYRVGREMLETNIEGDVLEAMSHLCKTEPHDDERHWIALASLRATQQAFRKTAYVEARQYGEFCLRLLGSDPFARDYTAARDALFLLVDTERHLGQHYAADSRLVDLLVSVRSPLERAAAIRRQSVRIAELGDWTSAVDRGLDGLRELGFNFPAAPTKWSLFLQILLRRLRLCVARTWWKRRPRGEDVEWELLRTTLELGPTFFQARHLLAAMIFVRVSDLLRTSQNAAIKALAHSLYASIALGIGDEKGCDANRAQARQTIPADAPREIALTSYFIDYTFGAHFELSSRDLINRSKAGFSSACRVGERVFAAQMARDLLEFIFFESLDEAQQALDMVFEFAELRRETWLKDQANVMSQVCAYLRSVSPEAPDLELPNGSRDTNPWQVFVLAMQRSFLGHLDGDPERVISAVETAADAGLLRVYHGTTDPFVMSVLAVMSLIAVERADPSTRHRGKYRQYMKICRFYANRGPERYGEVTSVLEAELRDMNGRGSTNYPYEKACARLDKSWCSLRCFVLELTARHHARHGNEHLANHYIVRAKDEYAVWGAIRKVCELEKRWNLPAVESRDDSKRVMIADLRTKLDLGALMDSSHAISRQVVFEEVIATVMSRLLETSGADRAVLVIPDGNRLRVAAEATPSGFDASDRIVDDAREPVGVLRTVVDTGQEFVLDVGNRYLHYFVQREISSALCEPILRQNEVTGVIYLENSVTADVFSQDCRVGVRVLAAQAAISLENALLYRELEEKVRVRTRELEEANTKMASVMREKERFLATVSHDFRSPLAIIKSCVQTIERDPDMSAEHRSRFLSHALANLERLNRLVKDLLDLARIEQHEAICSPVDLANVVMDVCSLYAEHAASKQICLETAINAAPVVMGDRLLLERAVGNVIDNALKFTESDGRVTVTVTQEGSWTCVSIKDSGIGIPADDLARVFDRFFQSESNPDNTGGSGLGLAIAYEIAMKLKGTVDVQSEIGHGTRFNIRLPLVLDSQRDEET